MTGFVYAIWWMPLGRHHFGERYGEKGAGYIHVHHLKPLSQLGAGYEVNPTEDMRPLCPNCHAVAHMRRPDPYTISELKAMLSGR